MSFGSTSYLRQGAWRDLRRWLLQERRNVIARLGVIHQELNRIGYIRILYARSNPNDPNSPMSEARVGLDVTPNTSLEKLLQAYIAQGGNPFDISMFLTPDAFEPVENDEAPDNSSVETDAVRLRETEPYGGTTYSASTDPMVGGLYTGGWLPLWRYPPRRFGSNGSPVDQGAELHRTLHSARSWASNEIRTLRHDLEARILKLCDLREQLHQEMDELLPQAVGGVVPGVAYVPDHYAQSHHLSNIVDLIDEVFYPLTAAGDFDFSNPLISTPNPTFPTLLDDAPTGEEDWCGLG
jgi:hypothetical protein